MNQERAQKFLLELPSIRNDLPFSPTLLTRLFSLTDDDSTSPLQSIAATIAEDQGLSARVLFLANSAYYGLQAQVGTISRAVAVLGLREVRGLVLVLGMRGLAAHRPLPKDFTLSRHLEHHLAVALAAMDLARVTGHMSPDSAYTAGVLHDIGKLLTALYRPEDWQAEKALAEAENLPWHEAEEHHWGLDHALVGAMMLRSWNLPESLTEPVNWHHAPEAAPGRREPGRLIGLADACVNALAGQPLPEGLIDDLAAPLGLGAPGALDVCRTALTARDPSLLGAALA